jgi:hypothetical protein
MDSMQGFGLNSQPVARREGDEKRRMIGDDSASWRGDRRRRGWNDSISGAWLLVAGVEKYLDRTVSCTHRQEQMGDNNLHKK